MMQLVLGSVLLTLALHLLLWSPELHTRDAPYWSGASVRYINRFHSGFHDYKAGGSF